MNELIKITENNGKRAVSARDLHAFLESKQDFSNWISNRIKKYDLIENQDFVRFNKNIETTGGRLIEYALSIDCAKELSMVEGNTKGKQARQYFIACEKAIKSLSKLEILQQCVNKLVDQEHELLRHEAELQRQAVEIVELKENAVEAETKIKELEIKTATRPDYYTVMAYATILHRRLDLTTAKALGKKATALSRENGLSTDRVKDPRFGFVNMYHESILKKIFNDYLK